VDISDIERLVESGIAAFPPSQLSEAASWLTDFGNASGEARYLTLASTLSMIYAAFEDNGGQMFTDTVEAVDAELKEAIPTILSTGDIAFASSKAQQLRDAVALLIQQT
jgi:hypothetical protein